MFLQFLKNLPVMVTSIVETNLSWMKSLNCGIYGVNIVYYTAKLYSCFTLKDIRYFLVIF